jgi:hypothetical protein
MANTAPAPKAVALVLVPALVLMLAFAFFSVGAFHDPTPHHVPVAIVGPSAVALQLNLLPGDRLDARHAASRHDALSQIDDRDVYGAYDSVTVAEHMRLTRRHPGVRQDRVLAPVDQRAGLGREQLRLSIRRPPEPAKRTDVHSVDQRSVKSASTRPRASSASRV